ncbi:BolA/IbaG family iron-sulfur metabolism protein [Ectothiorhodospiraceae bacterium BW-2]|nr:BolA/IbaG family iron-sulfur metabolism protein [Ectothiorhodospiraceae bacterium BW-2]
MQPEQVADIVRQSFNDCEVSVSGDSGHLNVTVIGEQFAGMSAVNKQRSVYKVLADYITSGELHAVNIHCHTPSERQKALSFPISDS